MPPQQSHGLLDRFDQLFGFGAHDSIHGFKGEMLARDTVARGRESSSRIDGQLIERRNGPN
jgi:predicted oxidoreductase